MPRPFLPEEKVKNHPFQIRFTRQEMAQIQALANSMNISVADLIRASLTEYLGKINQGKPKRELPVIC